MIWAHDSCVVFLFAFRNKYGFTPKDLCQTESMNRTVTNFSLFKRNSVIPKTKHVSLNNVFFILIIGSDIFYS